MFTSITKEGIADETILQYEGKRRANTSVEKGSHVTQSMLAEQANISVDTVKRLERGNEGSVNVLLAIADVYDVSLDYLVGCEDAAR